MMANKKKVFAYVHTHWDREWYREFEEFRLRLIEVMDKLFVELDKGALDSFYFDGQTSAIEDYLAIYPEHYDKVKLLVEQKKLFLGPFFCSTDEFLTNTESLIASLSFGIKKSKEFGCSDLLAYLSDTFGHSADTPALLKYAGIQHTMMWRGLGNLPSEFSWDGIKATYLLQGYFHDIFSQSVSYKLKAEYLKKFLDRIASRSSNTLLLPIGADHLQIPTDIKMQIAAVNELLEDYEIVLSSPFDYLGAVKDNYNTDFNCELMDNSENFLLKGVFSSRLDLKYENTTLEWMLYRIVQPMQAFACCLGVSKSFQNELDYACKMLIKNQAHDSIYGCSLDTVHREMNTRYEKIKQVASGVQNRVLRDLNGAGELCVLNLSSFAYSGAVKFFTEKPLPAGYNAQLVGQKKSFPHEKLFDPTQIPITEDITDIYEYLVPVNSVKPFSLAQVISPRVGGLSISNSSIENDNVALDVVAGCLVFSDKLTGIIYKDFFKIRDAADVGDSYTFGALRGDNTIFATLVRSELVEKGAVRSVLRLVYEIDIPETSDLNGRSPILKKHVVNMDVVLNCYSKFFEFKMTWDNHAKNHLLQVVFNMNKPITKTFSEDLLSLIERDFDPAYNIYDHLPAPRGVELKTNTAPLQRFVWCDGVGLMTKGLREYEVFGDELRLTVLRATGLISEPKNPSRGTPAGPPLVVEDLQMLRANVAKFALIFEPEPHNLYKYTENYYSPAVALFTLQHKQAFIELDNPHIIVSTIKLDESGDLFIRVYNASSTSQIFDFKHTFDKQAFYTLDLFCENMLPILDEITLAPKQIASLKLI